MIEKQEKMEERVNVKIPKEWHKYVKYEAISHDKSVQDMLVEMIKKYSESNIDMNGDEV